MNQPSFERREQTLVIRNGRIEITMDSVTGNLLKARDTFTGVAHCDTDSFNHDHARLFRLIALKRQERAYPLDSHRQKRMETSIDEKGITFVYPEIESAEALSGVSATVRIECAENEEILFTLTVSNNGNNPVHEIQFPALAGWKAESGGSPARMICGAKGEYSFTELPKPRGITYAGFHQNITVDYPGPFMYFPWVDVSGRAGGLSYINYMDKPYIGGIGLSNLAKYEQGSSLAFSWRHFPLIRKGDTWTSPAIGISLHARDWHATADRYYRWFAGRHDAPRTPDAVRAAIGFQNIILRSFDGTRVNEIESLTEHARVGREYGLYHLSVWDYQTLGNYTIYEKDLDLFDYRDDERNRLKKTIAKVKQEGTDISALVNFRHINVRSALYEEFKTEAKLRLDGSEWRENWNLGVASLGSLRHLGLELIMLSPKSPKCRARVQTLLDKYIELGYNSIFYDQPVNVYLDYNFKQAGDRPDDTLARRIEIMQALRDRLVACDRRAFMIGEFFEVFASTVIDWWMEWNTWNSIDAMTRVHYACPHALLSYNIDYTLAAETEASRAFAAGLYCCITINGCEANIGARPQLAAHIAQLAALRKKCAQRTVYARFMETRGVALKADDDIVAYAYDSSEGPAVVAAAGKNGGQATITIQLDKFHAPPGRVRNLVYTMEGGEAEAVGANVLNYTFGPNEVIVWYC